MLFVHFCVCLFVCLLVCLFVCFRDSKAFPAQQTSANQGPDSTFVDEASSTMSSPEPSCSRVVKLIDWTYQNLKIEEFNLNWLTLDNFKHQNTWKINGKLQLFWVFPKVYVLKPIWASIKVPTIELWWLDVVRILNCIQNPDFLFW